MMAFWLVVGAGLASLGLTGLVRRDALAGQLLDRPNARSSHQQPTPRGGGVAFVLVFLGGLVLLAGQGRVAPGLCWALAGAGGATALLGFLDDHGHIDARWRLLGHLGAALWLLVWLRGTPALSLAGLQLAPGGLADGLALLYLVWLLNLYNFMDGIDGLASAEALCACLGGALLLAGRAEAALPELLLGGAVAGFLVWNFPPARIFMGDAGSGFLGIVLGGLSLRAAALAPELFWSWLILLAVFVTDATLTLLRRLLRAEPVWQAHCSHAFQYAARKYGRHRPVTLAVVLINLCWLLPLALAVAWGDLVPLAGLLLAYGPLLLLALYFRAGWPEAGR